MSCDTFPYNTINEKAYNSNPAIQVFGNRLFIDQTSAEYLVEFLLIVSSVKKISDKQYSTSFPPYDTLRVWDNTKLEYTPKARLNLKLFAFLGASRLDTRHITHLEHHRELINAIKARISMAGSSNKDEVIRTIENLFLGFQGAGSGRTWCAQSFLPVSEGFLAGETIWNVTKAKRNPPSNWLNIFESLNAYLSMNRHRFLARGGEVLYLQICNALRQSPEIINNWVTQSGVNIDKAEQNPKWLHTELEKELVKLMNHCPSALTEIAEFIDSGVDHETAEYTDKIDDEQRYVKAGWCAADSWQEGYLFAVNVLRLCKANLDVIDRLYLLETACVMQVLRSLAMQSARCMARKQQNTWPGYYLAVSAPEEKQMAIKRISQFTLKMLEKQVFQSIRSDNVILPQGENQPEKALKEADKRYAGKFYIGLAKRNGLIVPRRGAGARFVMNEQLLRLLVLTIVPVGGRITFDTFKKQAELHYGFVFDADGYNRACDWAGYGTNVHLPGDMDEWLQDMLSAAGMLVQLSDSCALVKNPA